MKKILLFSLSLVLASCLTPEDQVVKAAMLFNSGQEAEAVLIYREAAEKGNTEAQLQLAKCYDFGKGVTQDMAEAVRWYTRAAQGGNTNAQDNLGTCYISGTAGNPSALNNLGLCYRNGEGTTKDDAKAAFCFQRAAEMGNANAQYNLGRCYYHGLGVAQDTEQARLWVSRAAAQGHKNARLFMDDNQWSAPM